ncbi:hypothetical protein [Amycolatopsis panacis]|uniref:hypothetical protein n=1 Tax=Amycolatopsis panacis TaxID=2340917 RepID=UPI000E7540F3|nr:hypothetical protein [Amycolatopsis panacis]
MAIAESSVRLGIPVPERYRQASVTTLGPAGTDAESLASSLFSDVRLAGTFREAMAATCRDGGCALVPAGYVHRDADGVAETWADLHFGFLGRLRMVALWEQETKTMCLAVNSRLGPGNEPPATLTIHPSTLAFAHLYAPGAALSFVRAKPLAAQAAAAGETAGCIASIDVVNGLAGLSVLEEFTPTMVWCLYAAA